MRQLLLETNLQKIHRTDPFRKIDQVFKLVIVTGQPVDNSSPCFDNQVWNKDKGVQKPFKFHAYNGKFLPAVWQGQSGLGFHAVFQLIDVVFMITSFSVKQEHFGARAFTVAGDVEKIAHIFKRQLLAPDDILIFAQNDQPTSGMVKIR